MSTGFIEIPGILFLAGVVVGLSSVFVWGLIVNHVIRSAFFQLLLPQPPKYANVGGTIMTLDRPNHYYRDAGRWGVNVRRWGLFWFRVVADYEQVMHMDGRFVRRVSQAVWAEDNEGYI